MSRRPQLPIGIAEPGMGPEANTGLLRMAICKVKPDGKIDQNSKTLGKLLLNPEAVEDSKTSNWIANNIPGQSDPLIQWTSGGPRLISFEALVTKDTGEFLNKDEDPVAGLLDSAVNAIGSIASNFLGVNLPPLMDFFAESGGGQGEDLSIEKELNYYRSLLYPTYADGRLKQSPPICVLYMGKTLSKSINTPSDTIAANHDLWVLTELRIRVTKQLPNLTPMEAVCGFRFMQYTVKSFGADHFITSGSNSSGDSGGFGLPIPPLPF